MAAGCPVPLPTCPCMTRSSCPVYPPHHRAGPMGIGDSGDTRRLGPIRRVPKAPDDELIALSQCVVR